jgi:hypothetical protein
MRCAWWGMVLCGAVLAAGGCSRTEVICVNGAKGVGSIGFTDPEVTISSNMATVAQVTWQTTTAAVGWVSVRDDQGEVLVTPLQSQQGTQHSVQLRGLRASTDHFATVHVMAGGQSHEGPEVSFSTGYLSNEVPTLTVEGYAEPGFHLAPVLRGQSSGLVMIVDMDGQPVWAMPLEERWTTRARLSMDGQAILVMHFSTGAWVDDPRITRFAFDGSVDHEVEAPTGHHDFVEVAEGRYRFLGQREIMVDGKEFQVDTLEEVELGGEAEIIFDFGDVLAVGAHFQLDKLDDGDAITHMNSINVDPATGRAVLAEYRMAGIYMVDLDTGSLLWTLDGHETDLRLVHANGGKSAPWGHGHEVIFSDRGVMAFLNDTDGNNCAAVVDVVVDTEIRVAFVEMAYEADPCITVIALGGLAERPSGNLVVTLTTAGQIDEVTAEGELQHRINSEIGAAFGYGQRVDSLYP